MAGKGKEDEKKAKEIVEKSEREQHIFYMVNRYLQNSNQTTYKQMMVLLEADFIKQEIAGQLQGRKQ